MNTYRALSSLRGLRGAPEVPPLCRETLVSRTANVGTVGKNRLTRHLTGCGAAPRALPPAAPHPPHPRLGCCKAAEVAPAFGGDGDTATDIPDVGDVA